MYKNAAFRTPGVRSFFSCSPVRVVGAAMALAVLADGCSKGTDSDAPEMTAVATQAVGANIHPQAIQIDVSANLYYPDPGNPPLLNPGATVDWVLDSDPNSGTGCLPTTGDGAGIATCVEPGVTGAPSGTGHSNGLRIVDGVDGADQNIFLTGGKENDTSTWNLGSGSIGSAKYDITQAYLANNQTTLFFGMERRGNNGTTAFDFEFNQVGSINSLVPTRTVGDVLFTFEMQGSGSSGSATPHYFTWNGSQYVEQKPAPAGIISSINNAPVPAAPWGYVDSHGAWVTGDLDKFEFAEAASPVSLLPGVNACGGTAFVQVRTRSSSTDKSDLKDGTRIFKFEFNKPTAVASLSTNCSQDLSYSAIGTSAGGGSTPNATCKWTFTNTSTNPPTITTVGPGAACSGSLSDFFAPSPVPPGNYTASVELTDPSSANCKANADGGSARVFVPPSVRLSRTGAGGTCPLSTDAVTYTAEVTGGSGNNAFSFTGNPPLPGNTAVSCSGNSCTINPSDNAFCFSQSLQVNAKDGRECPATSETETYSKVTTVTVSDN